jgi:hypothetical protein
MWVVSFTPRPLYSQGKSPWYPSDRRLCGPQSRSGRGSEEKNSRCLLGLEPPPPPIITTVIVVMNAAAGNPSKVGLLDCSSNFVGFTHPTPRSQCVRQSDGFHCLYSKHRRDTTYEISFIRYFALTRLLTSSVQSDPRAGLGSPLELASPIQ